MLAPRCTKVLCFESAWRGCSSALRLVCTTPSPPFANIAQSVERIHGKDEVLGSIPSVGSKESREIQAAPAKAGAAFISLPKNEIGGIQRRETYERTFHGRTQHTNCLH